MAIPSIERYKIAGPSQRDLDRYVSGASFNASIQSYVDINLSDSTKKEDLDEYLTSIGYIFVESNPTTTPDRALATDLKGVIQTKFVNIVTDISSGIGASDAIIPGMSIALTTFANTLLIQSTIASSDAAAAGTDIFHIKLDGQDLPGTGMAVNFSGASRPAGVSCVIMSNVLAGLHTVELFWNPSALGNIQIRPVTMPNNEHCSLLVQEIAI